MQEHLRRPNKQKSRKDLFAYTNLFKCGTCDATITAEIKKERYIYYHCTGSKGDCAKKNVPESVVEDKVGALLSTLHVTDEAQHTIHAAIKESLQEQMTYHTFNVERMERQIRTLQNRIQQSYADKLDGKINEDFWLDKNKEWLTQKEDLTAKLLDYQKTNTNYFEQVGLILELTKRAAQIFKRGSVEQKRKIVNLLLSKSVIHGTSIELEIKPPFDLILNTMQ